MTYYAFFKNGKYVLSKLPVKGAKKIHANNDFEAKMELKKLNSQLFKERRQEKWQLALSAEKLEQ